MKSGDKVWWFDARTQTIECGEALKVNERGGVVYTYDKTFGWAVRVSPLARRCASITGRFLNRDVMETQQEIIKKYERKFTDLFAEFYEAMEGDVKGCSCERVADILQPGGVSFFVRFNVW